MKNLVKASWYRITTTILLVAILLFCVGMYGSYVDAQTKVSKINETFTIPEHGTTTVYHKFTKDEYVKYLESKLDEYNTANKTLYDIGEKLRDNLIACQNE
jgi:LPS O-antigen subunit length determinant protein (WzzB/FepE family)